MIVLSRTSMALIFVATLVLVSAIVLVYIIYLSPDGRKAREDSVLGRAESEKQVVYTALDDTPIDMHAYSGEILIVTMWASWSPFTKADLVALHTLKNEFGDKITIRALNRKENKEMAIAYLNSIGKEEGIEYIIDPADHLYSFVGGYAMPETLVFDKVGNTITHIRGTLNVDELRNTLISSLEKE